MKIKKPRGSHNKISKKGVTLPEVIIGILFTAIIFSTAVTLWFAAGKVFEDTEDSSKTYGDARALETMLQNAASVAHLAAFTEPAWDYFYFYYDEVFCVSYKAREEDTDYMTISYDALSSADDVLIRFSLVGNKVLMEYKLVHLGSDSYFIDGGIILSDANPDDFQTIIAPAFGNLDNLYLDKSS